MRTQVAEDTRWDVGENLASNQRSTDDLHGRRILSNTLLTQKLSLRKEVVTGGVMRFMPKERYM